MKRPLIFGGILALMMLFAWSASQAVAIAPYTLPLVETVGVAVSTTAPTEAGLQPFRLQLTSGVGPQQRIIRGSVMGLMAATPSMPPAQLKVGQISVVPVSTSPGSPVFPTPGSNPFISGVTDHSRQIFLYGQRLGNRANIFSKIGDSITANDLFLAPIGRGHYDLRQYTYLAPVIAYFSQTNARTANSFANRSLAARGNWTAWQVLNPGAVFEPALCNPDENPLECEYRVVQPSVALIMIGTNDVRYTTAAQYEAGLRQILQTSINRGVIPVISTIPPLHQDWAVGRVEVINGLIVSLAREYDIPLWDYWAAVQGLPNDCLSADGVHPSVYTGHAADFSQGYLLAGYTVRNLLALQALDAVWRAALY